MKEFAWAVAGFLGIGAWVVVLGALLDLGIIGVEQGPWATIALVLWKLAISYRLYMLQASTFEIYAYFGGVVRNGAIAVFIGYLVWARFLSGWLETHAKGLETLLR
jgi:hypothetical protein